MMGKGARNRRERREQKPTKPEQERLFTERQARQRAWLRGMAGKPGSPIWSKRLRTIVKQTGRFGR